MLTKFVLEDPLIDEFILVESDVTFRGEVKGLHAKNLINSDERFAPFRHKIKIIEKQGRFFEGPPCYHTYYENEARSREAVGDYIKEKYGDQPDTWIIVSDCDEAVDCTDVSRRDIFLNHLQANADQRTTLLFEHYRYWYDFMNRCYWQGIVTPMVQMGALLSGKVTLRCRVAHGPRAIRIRAGDSPLFFEYTFCFPPEAMWKKLTSFIHDGYTPEELQNALLANHWVKARARGEVVGGRDDWFELVELTPQNSPLYVRENLSWLKTNAIPANYKENRQRLYGRR